jgi:hypothetical protein
LHGRFWAATVVQYLVSSYRASAYDILKSDLIVVAIRNGDELFPLCMGLWWKQRLVRQAGDGNRRTYPSQIVCCAPPFDCIRQKLSELLEAAAAGCLPGGPVNERMTTVNASSTIDSSGYDSILTCSSFASRLPGDPRQGVE